MENFIKIVDVAKNFGDNQALDGINAIIRGGVITGLVGPDGAGKTTLMRMMASLMKPTNGHINVVGHDTVKEAKSIHGSIGYMPQRFGLYEDLSVQENMNLYADLNGLVQSERADVFEKLLGFTRLKPFTSRLAGKLSGGMKQKLGLACALMARPKVLLLDEPGVGVDPLSRQDLWSMVQELAGGGMIVVWATAYLDEAERCDHVLLLNEGKLIFDGVPDTLTKKLSGRSYQITNIAGDRRKLLASMLDSPAVRDGVIQGASVRIVSSEGASEESIASLVSDISGELKKVEPRFEDSFIDLLGGHPGGRSAFAEKMDAIQTVQEVMVECKNLTKKFGNFAATDNVSFQVKRGEIFGLLGPNGAGKSTTFKMLCGLSKPTCGSAFIAGLDFSLSTGLAKTKLGYMAQKFSLYSMLSVKQNLQFYSGNYGLKGKLRAQRVDEMIETFELSRFLNQSPDELSLGYKQRLALACALMHRPEVLFLDEPTSGVDPITRREFWTHMTGLVEKGVTIMVTTHFMEEAEYCDRVALMHRAKLITLDTPDALKASASDTSLLDPTMEQAFIKIIETHEKAFENEKAA